jgi:hypothetical protein
MNTNKTAHKLFHKAWLVIVCISTIFGLLGVVSFWPAINIDVSTTSNQKSLFSTYFVLQNNNMPIRNVFYEMNVIDGKSSNSLPHIYADPGSAVDISAGEKYTLQFPNGISSSSEINRAMLEIIVWYKLPVFQHEFYFVKHFYTKKDKDGNYIWLPLISDEWRQGKEPTFSTEEL